jgi:hypothetical protein
VILVAVLSILGCRPAGIPIAIIPPTPKHVESPITNIKNTKINVDTTIDHNGKLGDKIEQTKQTLFEQKINIIEALVKAEKIREQALAKTAVSELDAISLIDEIKKVERRNLFLEQQNIEMIQLRGDQEKILKVIKNTLDKTEHQIILKDDEVRQLREQITYLSQNLLAKNKESENLKKQLRNEEQKSASATVYKNWCIGIVIVLTILFVGYIMIRTYIPTFKI